MDYKYIEQLLERYWQCETTLQEEAILHTFFSQEDVPAELQQYTPLFATQKPEEVLGDDFDARILAMVGQEVPADARSRLCKHPRYNTGREYHRYGEGDNRHSHHYRIRYFFLCFLYNKNK